jgi:hypothetical protein
MNMRLESVVETEKAWYDAVRNEFPRSKQISEIAEHIKRELTSRGYTPENTIFADSFCRDEINQRSVVIFADYWGENFRLGGLAGFPSAGIDGVGAYSHHVPEDDGRLFIAYGPHIGTTTTGELGKVDRRHMRHSTTSCGSLLGFASKLEQDPNYEPILDMLNLEQWGVEVSLLRHAGAISRAGSRVAETITQYAFHAIDRRLERTLDRTRPERKIAILGGTLINTPPGEEDYFAPLRFVEVQYGTDKADKIERILPLI